MKMSNLIDDFIDREINDLQEEGNLALNYCDNSDSGDYHILSYWISGTYDNVRYFINENYTDSLYYDIIDKYPYNLETLKQKLQNTYGEYSSRTLAYEALASLLLSEMQHYPQWFTVYGSEETDMIDFKKYNINNALYDTDEFPIIKQEDIIASMYGINDTVQPSDMYDVFAHYADQLKIKEETFIEDDSEPIFTPDVFLIAAVVARYKNYIDIKKKINSDYALKFLEISYLDKNIKELFILYFAIEDYYNRFSETPNGLPLHKDMINAAIINVNNRNMYKINYRIRGIKNKKTTWDDIAEIIYDIPNTVEEFQSFIIQIALDFKRELNGLEKVKNKDIKAIEGKYPNKYSITHGLTIATSINTHYKDSRGNDCKKPMLCNYSLALAEKQSLYIIKKSLRYAAVNPVISSSFGIDSITTLHLLRRVNKHNFTIVFNNSLVEYPELIKYKKQLCSEWDLNDKLIETVPIETYWSLQKKNGWNFERKGDRRSGKSTSEICCKKIKHEPMEILTKSFIEEENPIQVNFTGLRSDESLAREKAIKRDNIVYYSKSWRFLKVSPIAFFSDEMVWAYQSKYNIPYCNTYDKILYYQDIYDSVSEEEYNKVYYKPRIGCWSCVINKSRGYLNWLRIYYPKQYSYLMINKGLAKDLFVSGAKKLGIISENITVGNNPAQTSLFDLNDDCDNNISTNEDILNQYSLEDMESLIMKRPCKFLA
ncbi:phosphoadenosine phosphosulfate reductase family protein [uncultured Clostridium sp.]|uniref:phosphoadenosine phosphosulfate reductase family protein n=1 Tax=uncultured Clostridium sp. TaxID=59620 RepID=UPI0028E40A0B|nr:phosphoadenosine phosphosulfate reductase family protein [uncultured Clostridium sp.]